MKIVVKSNNFTYNMLLMSCSYFNIDFQQKLFTKFLLSKTFESEIIFFESGIFLTPLF